MPANRNSSVSGRGGGLQEQLWRTKGLMALVFALVALIGVLVALTLPSVYEARARLIVTGAEGDMTSVVSEAALMRSVEVAELMMEDMRLKTVFPALGEDCDEKLAQAGDAARRGQIRFDCFQQGAAALRQGFEANVVPGTRMIDARFRHSDSMMAADVLNAYLETYLTYRATLTPDPVPGDAATSLADLKQQLADADAEKQALMAESETGDFALDRAALRQRYQAINGDLLQAQSRRRIVDAQLAAYRERLGAMAAEREIAGGARSLTLVDELKRERREKLTRYKADSRVIRELDRRIALAEEMPAERDRDAEAQRIPNPAYIETEATIGALEAEAAALRQQERDIRAQLAELDTAHREMAEIEPQMEVLTRETAALERQIAQLPVTGPDKASVRILERARPPVSGTSRRGLFIGISLLFAGLAALLAGYLRAYFRRDRATAGGIAEATGLPVLSRIPEYS